MGLAGSQKYSFNGMTSFIKVLLQRQCLGHMSLTLSLYDKETAGHVQAFGM